MGAESDGAMSDLNAAYRDVLAWLRSFTDTERKLPLLAEAHLQRMAALIQLLANPQNAYPSVVIAGTKGKGSTAAMIESILLAADLQTGLYTSPHLHSFRERIRLSRQPIAKARLIDIVAALKPAIAQMDLNYGNLSTFEVETALALTSFAHTPVDIAVLEIGLGGRFDAVNVVTPCVSAVTSISFDHMDILGHTLRSIASEKAGIIKPGVPVVSAPQHPEVEEVLRRVAAERRTPLFIARPDGLQTLATEDIRPYPVAITPDRVALLGLFQQENARLAVSVAMLLREQEIAISDVAIKTGLATVSWPARLEVLQQQPLVVVDGAHNGDSMIKLLASLQQLFQFRRLICIIGALTDKDIDAMARAIAPASALVILTQSQHPRSAPLPQLEAAVKPYCSGRLLLAKTTARAVELALQEAQPDDLVCATGSLSVVAEARAYFGHGLAD
ncbi:MAG: bifunctional folylpolyglutamate synthase/dihydrofolate synthase [Chloroflexales bacterium]|nr:bifunctional folylpolyglutamate synthase/dihydrofolate synthase [Chloroflexales bacterium]